MTITGASMNNTILKNLKSKIAVIEEASVVLEPDFIGVLHKNIQHLVMLGD